MDDAMTECMRCGARFDGDVLAKICTPCLDAKPDLTAEERNAMNLWDSLADFLATFNRAMLPYGDPAKWTWGRNTRCKYVDLRIDMRDGGCIIRDREGRRITPAQLAWQWSREQPNPPEE
jgi:hypothetical protein